MKKIAVGSVNVNLTATPQRKKTSETAAGSVEIVCRNFSVCQIDVRLRDLHSMDPRVVAVSGNSPLPASFDIPGRLDRKSARVPFEMRAQIGTWTVQGPAGDADIRAECDGIQGGLPIPSSYGQVIVGVKIEQ